MDSTSLYNKIRMTLLKSGLSQTENIEYCGKKLEPMDSGVVPVAFGKATRFKHVCHIRLLYNIFFLCFTFYLSLKGTK